MRVQDITNRKYPSIYADELATKARAVLRERDLRTLPVTDENKRLLGVITRNDMMAITSSVSPIRVKGIMSTPRLIATPDMDAHSVVRKMLRLDKWYVPVVRSSQNKTYTGMLGLENFIAAYLKKETSRLSTPLSKAMSTELFVCSVNDEVDNVWRIMQEKSFSGCPVLAKGKLVGMLTQANLLESSMVFPVFEAKKGRFKAPSKISSVMKVPVISLKPTSTVKDAAELMLKKDIGRVPVVDRKDKLVGIVDREDIVRALIK
ncbi:MAG: HPP family protein [Candidatus Bathyarchaeia archaeon]